MRSLSGCVHRCLIAPIGLSIVTAAMACSDRGHAPAANPPAAASAARVEQVAYSGELPALPRVEFASSRPEPLLRSAYEFAARHPDVLRHVPCFCGCERNGHGNNEDCFIAAREADGKPKWNPHGIGCGICIDVANQAMQMHKAGATVVEIRKAIDAKYRADHPTSTPTPMPH
jgi:hypothetical protein